ncbi:hypothetical protein LINGRAHAP2_LOCUS5700 [Linum grandiflorum]
MAAKLISSSSYHSPPVNQSRSVFISSPDEPLLVECDDNHLVICSSGDLGLLLLVKWRPSQQREYSLWNPATRQVRRLPEPPPPPSGLPYPPLEHFSNEFGVGLDLVANVVKVVLVRYAFDCLSAPKVASPVYVYTLNGGEGWRKLADDYPYAEAGDAHSSRYELSNCTYLKGSIYWLCWEGHIASYVVTFDLGTEVFRRINLFPDHDSKLCTAFVYRDSFAVFSTEWFKSWSVDLWLLTGSNEWIKHSTFGPFPRRLYVFGCWKDDLLVALPTTDRNDVMVFDTVKQEMRVVVPGVDVFQLFSYKETLVCIQ